MIIALTNIIKYQNITIQQKQKHLWWKQKTLLLDITLQDLIAEPKDIVNPLG
jgi:hypothetical protein